MSHLSNPKICFIAGTLEHGGAERQLFYMLQALTRRGATPRVLCFDRGEFWEEPIRSLGVSVIWVGQQKSRIQRLFRILREIRTDRPAVLQSQHFFANSYVGLCAFGLRVSGIGAMRSDGSADLIKNGRLGGWLNLHSPRILAANSRLAMRQATARGISPTRLYFLPNVVDIQRFKPATSPGNRPLTLIAVGRLVKEKRFDRFISVLGRLRRELKAALRGWIVGPARDQVLRCELENQAARLGLFPGCLEFLGEVSDMGPLYQQADVCVLTSDFEGTPNVLLEAMASGLPVVSTDVGGVPDIVQHGSTGFLTHREDTNGMAAALAGLAVDATRRAEMGRRGREYIEQHHSLGRLPAYLAGLYARVPEAPRPEQAAMAQTAGA